MNTSSDAPVKMTPKAATCTSAIGAAALMNSHALIVAYGDTFFFGASTAGTNVVGVVALVEGHRQQGEFMLTTLPQPLPDDPSYLGHQLSSLCLRGSSPGSNR